MTSLAVSRERDDGMHRCTNLECDWAGLPTTERGTVILSCPKCEPDESAAEISRLRTLARTSRNAPCPCGSGKKFKRCCGG